MEWEFWANFDTTLLSKCEEFWVLCVPGFRESVGIKAERSVAAGLGLPMRFLVPSGDGYTVTADEPPE